MSLLIRKINKSKWYQIDIKNDSDVKADAITNCLKTKDNSLSVWHVNNENNLDNGILALILNLDHLETIDIIVLEVNFLQRNNINVIESPVNISKKEFSNIHRDLTDLTYSKLGIIKNHIIDRIRKDHLKRYTRGNLKKLLNKSLHNKTISPDDLPSSIHEKI